MQEALVEPARTDEPRPTTRHGSSPRPSRLGGIDILVNNVGVAPPRLDGFLAITDASGRRR